MAKKVLIRAAVLALVATVVQGGEIVVIPFPTQTQYVPQSVCQVQVLMDIGYWIECVNQNDALKLQQQDIRTYEGCLALTMRSNFNATLSCDIAPTGVVAGQYECSVDPPNIFAGETDVLLCAKLTDADIINVAGGTQDVHVATITIKVIPQQ